MKKAIKALFVLLFMTLTISGSLATDKTKKPEILTVDNYLAVFDFEVTTSDKGISRPLTESVRRELVLSGKYKVIDRGNMEKILGEQKLQMSGCVSGECIVEAGQLLGVGKLISGTVSMVGKTFYLTLSLISVKTGEIENVAEDTCKCEVDELLGSTKRLAKKLLGEKVDEPVAILHKPATITIVPPAAPAKEIARDGRFIIYENETVLDTRTGLMWAAKDNGSNINWQDAKRYCESYSGGGYSDWRIPTQDELAGLYDPSKTYQSECKSLLFTLDQHLTELIRLTCSMVWASETRGSQGAFFSFDNGNMSLYPHPGWNIGRALPVRSGK